MNKDYVSEFDQFMNRYLADHPEIAAEQYHNWQFFWECPSSSVAPHLSGEDCMTDSMYGFSWSAWRTQKESISKAEAG